MPYCVAFLCVNMILKFKSCLNAAYKVILTQPVCVSYLYGREFLPN